MADLRTHIEGRALDPERREQRPQLLGEHARRAEGIVLGVFPSTIKTKAELAKTYGGVMIWEFGQDAGGNDALFKVVKDAP